MPSKQNPAATTPTPQPGWIGATVGHTHRLLNAPGAGMALVVVLFMILVGVMQPSFVTGENLSVLMQQTSALIIASYGMAFVILSANIDLSTGSIVAVSSCVAALVAKSTGNVVIGMLAGAATGSTIGAVNGILVAYVKIPSFIATFGTLTYGAGIALTISKGVPIYSPPAGFAWLGQARLGLVPVSFVLAILLMFVCQFALNRTALGRNIRLIGENSRAAALAGINVRLIQFVVFVIAGALAAIAALIMSSRVNSGQPEMDPLMQFTAIAAVAVGGVALTGGRGQMQQVFIGGFLLGVLGNALNVLGLSSFWQQVAVGAIIVLATIFGQRGFGSRTVYSIRKAFVRPQPEGIGENAGGSK